MRESKPEAMVSMRSPSLRLLSFMSVFMFAKSEVIRSSRAAVALACSVCPSISCRNMFLTSSSSTFLLASGSGGLALAARLEGELLWAISVMAKSRLLLRSLAKYLTN